MGVRQRWIHSDVKMLELVLSWEGCGEQKFVAGGVGCKLPLDSPQGASGWCLATECGVEERCQAAGIMGCQCLDSVCRGRVTVGRPEGSSGESDP